MLLLVLIKLIENSINKGLQLTRKSKPTKFNLSFLT